MNFKEGWGKLSNSKKRKRQDLLEKQQKKG